MRHALPSFTKQSKAKSAETDTISTLKRLRTFTSDYLRRTAVLDKGTTRQKLCQITTGDKRDIILFKRHFFSQIATEIRLSWCFFVKCFLLSVFLLPHVFFFFLSYGRSIYMLVAYHIGRAKSFSENQVFSGKHECFVVVISHFVFISWS